MSDELANLAAAMLNARVQRRGLFGHELFGGEQAWDMLLVLFVADARGERLTGRVTVERSASLLEVGRRWMVVLTRKRYIVGDGEGDLDDTLTLTPHALDLMETWLRRTAAGLGDVPRRPGS